MKAQTQRIAPLCFINRRIIDQIFINKLMNLKRNLRNLKRTLYKHFWWFVLTACLAALLFYGLSTFTAKPTVETITTHAPVFNANSNQMREFDFQPPRKARRRE